MFKLGDVVLWKEKTDYYVANKGAKAKIVGFMQGGKMLDVVWLDVESRGQFDGGYSTHFFEKCVEPFNLKTMPWKIIVNSPEESRMAQEWLFEQGVEWKLHGKKVKELNVQVFTNCRASDLKPEPNLLYSYDAKNSVAPEIKLTFGVTSVEYPEPIAKETEAQKKMKELEDKQREISEELAKLRESM